MTMFVILLTASYQAFKHFAGVDPIKADPQAVLLSLVTEEGAVKAINAIFNLKFPSSFEDLKNLANTEISDQGLVIGDSSKRPEPGPNAKKVLTFAIMADSHNDNTNLRKALETAKGKEAKFVIGLGDYTEVGEEGELRAAHQVFRLSGLPFYLTAGDHDLWNARDKGEGAAAHYTEVFGSPYQSFGDSNIRFVIVYNSDNYQGVDDYQLSWLQEQLTAYSPQTTAVDGRPLALFVFMHEPLYHPSSDHVMGKVREDLKVQAEFMTEMLKDSRVSEVFYGDTHFGTSYQDPKSGLFMTAVGAVTEVRNAQRPRFLMVDVFDDGKYNLQEIEIE